MILIWVSWPRPFHLFTPYQNRIRKSINRQSDLPRIDSVESSHPLIKVTIRLMIIKNSTQTALKVPNDKTHGDSFLMKLVGIWLISWDVIRVHYRVVRFERIILSSNHNGWSTFEPFSNNFFKISKTTLIILYQHHGWVVNSFDCYNYFRHQVNKLDLLIVSKQFWIKYRKRQKVKKFNIQMQKMPFF